MGRCISAVGILIFYLFFSDINETMGCYASCCLFCFMNQLNKAVCMEYSVVSMPRIA